HAALAESAQQVAALLLPPLQPRRPVLVQGRPQAQRVQPQGASGSASPSSSPPSSVCLNVRSARFFRGSFTHPLPACSGARRTKCPGGVRSERRNESTNPFLLRKGKSAGASGFRSKVSRWVGPPGRRTVNDALGRVLLPDSGFCRQEVGQRQRSQGEPADLQPAAAG